MTDKINVTFDGKDELTLGDLQAGEWFLTEGQPGCVYLKLTDDSVDDYYKLIEYKQGCQAFGLLGGHLPVTRVRVTINMQVEVMGDR